MERELVILEAFSLKLIGYFVWIGEETRRTLEVLDERLLLGVFADHVLIGRLMVNPRVIDSYDHAVDAQKKPLHM